MNSLTAHINESLFNGTIKKSTKIDIYKKDASTPSYYVILKNKNEFEEFFNAPNVKDLPNAQEEYEYLSLEIEYDDSLYILVRPKYYLSKDEIKLKGFSVDKDVLEENSDFYFKYTTIPLSDFSFDYWIKNKWLVL